MPSLMTVIAANISSSVHLLKLYFPFIGLFGVVVGNHGLPGPFLFLGSEPRAIALTYNTKMTKNP